MDWVARNEAADRMSEPSATRRLARYAVETRYHDLPDAVVIQAKNAIRDFLGCLLGGTALPAGQRLRDLILSMAAEGQATVAGVKRRVTPPLASYINAQLTNLLDFDDTLEAEALGHPGATTIPAALALAEQRGASGKQFLTAVVVGYDVLLRVALAGKPTFERSKQVRGLAPWQVFGAVAAAVHILGLNAEAAARAFGLAALHAPVPFVGKIYEERPMWALKNNFGWATLGGVLGALFAAEGLDANHEILEGETGFWAMAGSDRCDFTLLTEGLGSTYSILQTSFKPYSSCRHTHSALDAVSHIIRSSDIRADDVRSVLVRSSSKIKAFADYRPQSFIDAEFSLPYLVAMVLLQVPPGYAWLQADRWRDPNVLSLADRVHLEVDPEAEVDLARGYMRVKASVELENGQVEEAEVTYPGGHRLNPLSAGELQQKFLGLAEPVIGQRGARQLSSLIDRLDELSNLEELTAYLAGTKPGREASMM
jgi:2-methylcitrate dehydratase PrpD